MATVFRNLIAIPRFRHWWIQLSILLFPLLSLAQPLPSVIHFEQFGEEQGLNSANLSTIFQDSRGYLYIGSLNGVFRYDGFNFEQLKMDVPKLNGVSRDYIKTITEDAEGDIWVTAENGSILYMNHSSRILKIFELKNFNQEEIKRVKIQCDKNGNIWVLLNNSSLYKLDKKSHRLIQPGGKGSMYENISNIQIDHEGRLWFLKDSKLNFIQADTPESEIPETKTFAQKSFGRINQIYPSTSGQLWLGGYSEYITCFDIASEKFTDYEVNLIKPGEVTMVKNRINSLTIDNTGLVWAGTNNNGLLILNPKSGKRSIVRHDGSNPTGLSYNTVTKVLKDHTGNIWVSTWGKGLNKYAPSTSYFHHFNCVPFSKNSLIDPLVTTFYESDENHVWIASNNGLNFLDKNTGNIIQYPMPMAPSALGDNPVNCLVPSPENKDELWLGTNKGLKIFNKNSGSYRPFYPKNPTNKYLQENIVYFLSKDKNGNPWAITYHPYTLFKYIPEKGDFELVDVISKIESKEEPITMADRQQNAWIGIEEKTFYRFNMNTERLESYHIADNDTSGFYSKTVGHFLSDKSGRLWMGTEAGLFYLENIDSKNGIILNFIGKEHGLSDNHIKGILEDDAGYIWVSSTGGISRIHPITFEVRNLDKADGLQANEFGYETFHKGEFSGDFYFGGTNGFNYFDPLNIPLDTFRPGLNISDVLVLESNVFTRKSLDVNHQILELGPKEKVIQIKFAALHFASPEKNIYSCIMEGFDTDWRSLGNTNQISYSNLDPGNYTFKVKAANKDGIWNEEPAILKIKVFPPWWKSWWAYILYVATISTLVFIIYLHQLKRQQEKLESARILEMDRLKSQLYTNITHEFRTPLTVISAMSDLIEKPANSRELIKRNAANLLNLVNQLLDLAKLESGHLKLEMKQADVVPFLQYLAESFHSLALAKNINLVTYMETDQILMDFDENKLNSIVSNLLSNAIKFTPEKGKIIMHVNREIDELVIKVKDNGIGISEESLPNIFDRFYQVDSSHTRKGEGTGVGLTVTKELVELMRGEIQVKSTPGQGTEFILRLPITQNEAILEESNRWITAKKPIKGNSSDLIESNGSNTKEGLPQLLLIEDNKDVATFIKIWLQDKYQIDHAEDGALGVNQAYENIPDIIISDIMMPEKDGFEVCQELKSNEKTSHIPIILLTAKADVDSRLEGLSHGADAYLSKPFLKEELEIRLEKLIELRKKLQTKYSANLIQNHEPETPEDQFLQKVNQQIEDHLDDPNFGNAQLASRLHLSESQLFRKLKALTDKSTAIYIRSYRLQKGKELVLNSDLSISEIAYQVGFSDPSYFSRTFSKEFGNPPNAMRK